MNDKNKNIIEKKKGIGLIEIVIGVAVLATSLLAISSFYQKSLEVSTNTTNTIQAGFLLEEGIEVARFLRDDDWDVFSQLTSGVDYYLIFNGATWATTTTNTFIDGLFERKLVLGDVYRDVNDVIVASGGVLDPNIKKVTATLSWRDNESTTTRSVSTYLANIFAN